MSDTKVSVIIPVYNNEKYLPQCIESCINQTLKEIEIICVNDGSSDNSLGILKHYAKNDNRIKIIDKENEGAGAARNDAVKIASGEYLIFIDSDDYLELNALELLYNRIVADESDVVFFNAYFCFEQNGTRYKYNAVEPYSIHFNNPTFSVLEAKNFLFETNAMTFRMYKKKLWIDNNIKYSNHKFGEDLLPYIRFLANSQKISFLTDYLYNYRKHENSATHNNSISAFDLLDTFYLCENALKESQYGQILMNSYLNNRIRSLLFGYNCVDNSRRFQYYEEIKKIFQYIINTYGLNSIEKSENVAEVKKVISMFYTQYRFSRLSKTLFYVLKSHIA